MPVAGRTVMLADMVRIEMAAGGAAGNADAVHQRSGRNCRFHAHGSHAAGRQPVQVEFERGAARGIGDGDASRARRRCPPGVALCMVTVRSAAAAGSAMACAMQRQAQRSAIEYFMIVLLPQRLLIRMPRSMAT